MSASGAVKYSIQHEVHDAMSPITFGDMLSRVGRKLHVDFNISLRHKISFVDFHGAIVSKNRKFVVKNLGKTKLRRRLLCKTPVDVLPWLNTTSSGVVWSGEVLDLDTWKEIPFRVSTSSSEDEDSD